MRVGIVHASKFIFSEKESPLEKFFSLFDSNNTLFFSSNTVNIMNILTFFEMRRFSKSKLIIRRLKLTNFSGSLIQTIYDGNDDGDFKNENSNIIRILSSTFSLIDGEKNFIDSKVPILEMVFNNSNFLLTPKFRRNFVKNHQRFALNYSRFLVKNFLFSSSSKINER